MEWETQDSQEAISRRLDAQRIAGIQRGLDDFEAGRFRSFDEFAEEHR